MQNEPWTIEQRCTRLNREIDNYIKDGFRLVSRTDTTAHLRKYKQLNWGVMLVLFLLGFIFVGWIMLALYLLNYSMFSKDIKVLLSIDEFGQVQKL